MARFIAVFSSQPAAILAMARRLYPHIELCPPGLLLKVTARDEQKILKELQKITPQGSLKIGLASTRITALLAAQVRSNRVVPDGKEREFLAPLPVNLLSLVTRKTEHKLFLTFFRWGIRTLGELAALPEKELAARLGQTGINLQKMARGKDIELFLRDVEESCFEESQDLEWTLDSLEPLIFILGEMLDRLSKRLQRHGWAVEYLQVVLELANRTSCTRTLRLAFPIRDPKVLLSLVRLNLQSHPPDSGIEGVSLRAFPARQRIIQHSLLERPAPHSEQLSRTLGRLNALLGEDALGSPRLLDTHRPDTFTVESLQIEQKRIALSSLKTPNPKSKLPNLPRLSLRRFRPPQPTGIRLDQIVTYSGPWRSSGDWWTGTSKRWWRDEWDVEMSDGMICRIFWDHGQKGWFLEGVYD